MTSIGVIIPTVGRESLSACVQSVATQAKEDDRVMVAVDTELPFDYQGVGSTWQRVPDAPLGMFGHAARNWIWDTIVADKLRINFLWSLDDDDVALPGALDAIHAATNANPGRWLAFKMLFGANSHAAGHTVWREPKVELGNIGTPCIVMPVTAKSRWGALGVDPRTGWYGGEGYFGDYQIARDLEAELGPPVWVPHVVAEIRP